MLWGGTEPLIIQDNDGTLDKTFGEIKSAFNSGSQIRIALEAADSILYFPISSFEIKKETGGTVDSQYVADTDEDYPVRGK